MLSIAVVLKVGIVTSLVAPSWERTDCSPQPSPWQQCWNPTRGSGSMVEAAATVTADNSNHRRVRQPPARQEAEDAAGKHNSEPLPPQLSSWVGFLLQTGELGCLPWGGEPTWCILGVCRSFELSPIPKAAPHEGEECHTHCHPQNLKKLKKKYWESI